MRRVVQRQHFIVVPLVALMTCMTSVSVLAQDLHLRIQEAVIQYTQAMEIQEHSERLEGFRRAGRLFSGVIEEYNIDNVDLYVNLGNAALQCNRLGVAVLAYRRALAIAPGHVQAQRNLDHARSGLPDWVPRPQSSSVLDTFFVWNRLLSRSGQGLAAALCFAMAAVAMSVAIRWQRSWARVVAVILIVVWMFMIGLPVWQWGLDVGVNQAVVTVDEVVGRSADSLGAPIRFSESLPGGTEVQIIERRGDWALLRLANGLEGWVRASAVTTVARQ